MRCNDVLSVALGLALVLTKPALAQSQSSGVSTVAGGGPGGAASGRARAAVPLRS